MPYFINYNNTIANNFKYIRNLNLKSYRKPWSNTTIGKTLKDLFTYDKSSTYAIIIEESVQNVTNLEKYATILVTMFKLDNLPKIQYKQFS